MQLDVPALKSYSGIFFGHNSTIQITVYYILCFLDSTQDFNVTSLNETIEVLYDNQEITLEASQELVLDDEV